MVAVVVEKAFAIAAIELGEEILIALGGESVGTLDDDVIVENVPARTLDEGDRSGDFAIDRLKLPADLIDAAVAGDILIVYAVDNRNPVFAEYDKLWVDHERTGEAEAIP